MEDRGEQGAGLVADGGELTRTSVIATSSITITSTVTGASIVITTIRTHQQHELAQSAPLTAGLPVLLHEDIGEGLTALF